MVHRQAILVQGQGQFSQSTRKTVDWVRLLKPACKSPHEHRLLVSGMHAGIERDKELGGGLR